MRNSVVIITSRKFLAFLVMVEVCVLMAKIKKCASKEVIEIPTFDIVDDEEAGATGEVIQSEREAASNRATPGMLAQYRKEKQRKMPGGVYPRGIVRRGHVF